MMKILSFRIITKNQNKLEKAQKLAKELCNTLNTSEFKISKYYKFDYSYEIEITIEISKSENSIIKMIDLSDKICSPWNLNFNRTENEIELYFFKNEISKYEKVSFNVIKFINVCIDK